MIEDLSARIRSARILALPVMPDGDSGSYGIS